MDFKLNNNVRMGVASEQMDDFSWNEVSDLKKKQQLLTDVGESEEDNYNYAIEGLLGETKVKDEEGFIGIDFNGGFKPFTKENIKYYDNLINTGEVAFDENGVQTKGVKNYNLSKWNALKNKGVTPDSLQDTVRAQTQEKWMSYQSKMTKYDKDESTLASVSANLWGGIKALAHDPVTYGEIMLEMRGVKVGNTISSAQKYKKTLITNMPKIQKMAKKIDDMMKHNPTGAKQLKDKMDKMLDITTKNIKKATDKFGVSAVEEVTAFQRMLEKKGLSPDEVIQTMIRKSKDKKNPFTDGKSADLIRNMTKGDMVKDMANQGGIAGMVAGFSEWIRQEQTYDFKHDVLPQYDKAESNKDIALNAGFGMLAGMVFEPAAALYMRYKNKDLTGWTLGDDAGVEDNILKSNSQISSNEPVDLDGSRVKQPPEEKIETKPIEERTEENIQYAEDNLDFQQVTDKYNKQQSELELIQQCINGGM